MTVVLGAQKINQTIVATYEDCNRMINFCKDDGESVSRDFYDWYLKDKPELFVKSGMLLVDNVPDGYTDRFAVSFDFTNPDECLFCSYVYKDQTVICKWIFRRSDNITMNDVQLDVRSMSISNFEKVGFPKESFKPKNKTESDLRNKKIDDIKSAASDAVSKSIKHKLGKGYRKETTKEILDKALREGIKELIKMYAQGLTYFTYALMYYVSKQEPEIVDSQFSQYSDEDVEKVKGFYKYSGYVDLRDNKIYKPTIKKNPDDPTRDYHRHIQAWTVRGHYRRTKNGLIWIESHIKGKGELEKRIYGTEDEKGLNIIPKVFEVEKTVKRKPDVSETNVVIEIPKVQAEEKSIELPKKKKFDLFKILFKLFGIKRDKNN